jgi:hypothetical protein
MPQAPTHTRRWFQFGLGMNDLPDILADRHARMINSGDRDG